MKLIKILTICLLLQACQNKNESIIATQSASAIPFLQDSEIPNVFVREINEELFILEIKNKLKNLIKINIENNPGKENVVKDIFNALYCDKKATIIVISQNNETGVSTGIFYNNVIIDSNTGELLKIIYGGEFNDKQTGAIISDDQKSAISALKSNSSKDQKCSK